MFSFVEEIEGLDFIGSLKVLAARAGVELEPIDRSALTAKEKIYNVLAAAEEFYITALKKTPQVGEYLISRGLKAGTIKDHALGFAPDEWEAMSTALKQKSFSNEDLIAAGLSVKSPRDSSRVYDRFRRRIMFPIHDSSGRTIGFSGRIFGPSDKEAKYINSPETILYNKSRALYLYDRARPAMRRNDRAVLVEGQFDAVLSHQAGVEETIAVSGTALTAEHLQLVKRLTGNLLMAFDSDAAGLKASSRAIELALDQGFEVKAVALPTGLDPADLIRQNEEHWRVAIAAARHIIDFLLDAFAGQASLSGGQARDLRHLAHLVEAEIYPYVARLPKTIDRAYFIEKIASRVQLPDEVIKEGVLRAARERGVLPVVTKENQSSRELTRQEKIEEGLIGLLFWQEGLDNKAFNPDERMKELAALISQEYLGGRLAVLEAQRERLIMTAELTYQTSAKPLKLWQELLSNLEETILRRELDQIKYRLRAGEPVEKDLERSKIISKRLDELKNIL